MNSMKLRTALPLLAAVLCLSGPAAADGMRTHGLRTHGHIIVAQLAPQSTYAPIAHKVYGDPRWPYVSWRGSWDSLYAPGPRVTFIRTWGY